MPVDPKACVRISAFNWVPPFAQGYVRDLRVRWALEEAGIPYAVRKLNAAADRPADYFEEQPFGQVPSYRDGNISLFESGAIVLHIGRDHEVLLPHEAARARATAWLIAAQNSVEPFVMQLATIDIFCAGEPWAKERRPAVVEMIGKRLSRLADALGDKSAPCSSPRPGVGGREGRKSPSMKQDRCEACGELIGDGTDWRRPIYHHRRLGADRQRACPEQPAKVLAR